MMHLLNGPQLMCYVRESVAISLCIIVKQTQLSISGGCGGVPPLPISRVRSLHRAPTPRGAQSQLLKKTFFFFFIKFVLY